MLHIISSELIHLIIESFFPFTNMSLFLSPLTLPIASFLICFYGFNFHSFWVFWIAHMNNTMDYLSFSVQFTSLIKVTSRFIYVVTKSRNYFSRLKNIFLYILIHHILFLYSLADDQLGCFCNGAISDHEHESAAVSLR